MSRTTKNVLGVIRLLVLSETTFRRSHSVPVLRQRNPAKAGLCPLNMDPENIRMTDYVQKLDRCINMSLSRTFLQMLYIIIAFSIKIWKLFNLRLSI